MEPSNLYDFYTLHRHQFSKELLTRYALSLQTKPLVILTGISGTGKTKIAQVFADYMCQDLPKEEKAKRIAFIPVRPDWMDNRGLLGYYNPLTEKYQATVLLRLLLKAAKEENKGQPFFVILDEMNLAKVEYYFSDFLSLLESRTQGKDTGEPLRLHDQRGAVTVMTDDELVIPSQMDIPVNVYFTGTVNVDESTYMFSPKVLDRANVIEFNEVDLVGYRDKDTESHRFAFQDHDLRKRLPGKSGRPFCTLDDFKQYQKLLGATPDAIAGLYQRLYPHHLHFGYRVINEIARFVNLAQEQVEGFDLNTALDIQFLQKILPKLHGTQAKLKKPLTEILAFCYGLPSGEEPGQDRVGQAIAFDPNAVYPRTAQKTARMLRALEVQGYASFIE